ncbi:MAG: elongation factor Ts [Cryomorphaceae bacterium]|nr:elongation factor Ts [Cryomorphaceae bacterium]
MMAITAAEVNKLRKQTGAGMMDCKKALTESNGDFEEAINILRKKGQKVAANRADRETSEGCALAAVNSDSSFGAIVAISCETDFVAKNDNFVALTQSILDLAMEHKPADAEALKALSLDGKISVGEKLIEQNGVIGEKIELAAYETLNAPYVSFYVHMNNKLATIVGLNDVAEEAAKDVAMQAAAMSPVALNRDSVPQEIIDKELEIGKELARQEGKPETMLDKIAQGRLNKFFKESTLVDQDFIKDGKLSVSKYLDSVKKGLHIVEYKRVALG